VWGSQQWRADVRAWAGGGVLAEQRTRPWSTLWTVETGAQRLWFKENCPAHRAEATVHSALARIAPGYVDEPVRVRADRGWLLTRDGGPALDRADAVDVTAILRDHAALQRRTIGRRDELVAAGLRVADPRDAADLAVEQAQLLAALPADDPRHLAGEQRDAVLAVHPALREAGEELAAGPVPLTLDQADLFPRNVFPPRPGGGPHRFFDFADAVWAHPFGAPLLLLWQRLRGRPSGPVLDCRADRDLLEVYLDCWTDFASLAELRRLAESALRIAPLHRTSAWLGILATADEAAIAQHGRTPWSWLKDVTKPVVAQD
jgi:hypothetical protein